MLSVLLSWLYITLLSFLYGWNTLCFMKRVSLEESSVRIAFPLIPLLGLAEISVLTGYLSLVMGIALTANLIVILGALVMTWFNRSDLFKLSSLWQEHRFDLITLTVLFLILVLKSAVAITTYGTETAMFHSDTAYYHAPSIRWIEQYGLVPGLGNLLPPLAVDYLWFQPQALFSFSFFLKQPLHALSGWTVFFAFWYALGGLKELSQKPWRFSTLFRILLLLPLLELSNYIVSASGDEPAAIFTLVTLALACLYVEQEEEGNSTEFLQFILIILALFTVVIKWSVLPLLLIPIYIIYKQAAQLNKSMMIVSLSLFPIILLPKLIRSIFLSGYLIYPLPNLDLFNFDWKMPVGVVVSEKKYIETMSRITFDKPGELLTGGLMAWFPSWFEHVRSTPLSIGLGIALLMLILTAIGRLSNLLPLIRCYRMVYLTTLLGIVYWFWAAPSLRFGYGFLIAAVLLLTIPACLELSLAIKFLPTIPYLQSLMSILIIVITFNTCPQALPGYALGTGIVVSDFYPRQLSLFRHRQKPLDAWLYQDDYPHPKLFTVIMNGIHIHRPLRGQLCWNAPLPCTPYLYQPILARGVSLKDGFRASAGNLGGLSSDRIVQEWKQQKIREKKP